MATHSSVLQCGRPGFNSWVGKIPWRREWLSTQELLPGEFHGQRSLVGYSLWGHKELDMTEQLIFSRLKKKKHMRGSSMESAKKKKKKPFHP